MRRRILFLSQCLPYPPDSGVTNRTYHILAQLQQEFDITLLAFSRRNHQPNAESRGKACDALGELCEIREPSLIASEWSWPTRVWNHGRSIVLRRPYVYYEYAATTFASQLQQVARRRPPALVHLDSLDLYRWIRPSLGIPVTCTHHNIESDLLRLRAGRTASAVFRWYLRHQADLLEHIEKACCGKFDMNVMVSELDAVRLQTLVPSAKTTVAENGVDIEYFQPSGSGPAIPGRVVFVGPTYMLPNRDGIDFFLDQIWPIIRERAPASSLHLVGKNRDADRARFSRHPGVTCQGHVPDIRPHVANAQCAIVPLRIGGGTRLKILDAWAMGKTVVSTSIGCEGLDTKDGENIIIRDRPEEFAHAVVEVLVNDRLRTHIERNARATAEGKYSWQIIGQRLRDCYAGLLDASRREIAGGMAL